jgi:hypothetical protein
MSTIQVSYSRSRKEHIPLTVALLVHSEGVKELD